MKRFFSAHSGTNHSNNTTRSGGATVMMTNDTSNPWTTKVLLYGKLAVTGAAGLTVGSFVALAPTEAQAADWETMFNAEKGKYETSCVKRAKVRGATWKDKYKLLTDCTKKGATPVKDDPDPPVGPKKRKHTCWHADGTSEVIKVTDKVWKAKLASGECLAEKPKDEVEPPPTCPPGNKGCKCYDNGTCNDSLECVEGTCKDPCVDPEVRLEDGSCGPAPEECDWTLTSCNHDMMITQIHDAVTVPGENEGEFTVVELDHLRQGLQIEVNEDGTVSTAKVDCNVPEASDPSPAPAPTTDEGASASAEAKGTGKAPGEGDFPLWPFVVIGGMLVFLGVRQHKQIERTEEMKDELKKVHNFLLGPADANDPNKVTRIDAIYANTVVPESDGAENAPENGDQSSPLDDLTDKVDGLVTSVDSVNGALGTMDTKLGSMDTKLDAIDAQTRAG